MSVKKNDLNKQRAFSFLIGRENTVDIRITDISVSRAHAYINYYNGNFYVMDNGSKFGTLTLVQKPVEISYNSNFNISMQLGRYLISVKPEMMESKLWFRKKYTRLLLQEEKTFDDYIHSFPYLLGLKLGVINRRSIKTFKGKDGHEALNETHKRKMKRKVNAVYADDALQCKFPNIISLFFK